MVNLLTMKFDVTDAALVNAEMCIWTSGLAGFQEFGSFHNTLPVYWILLCPADRLKKLFYMQKTRCLVGYNNCV